MSTYSLLAGGYRSNIALLSFTPSSGTIKTVSESPTPANPSWVEDNAAHQAAYFAGARPGEDTVSPLFSLSEDEKKGVAISLQKNGETLEVTSQRATLGGPAHIHCMKDGSGIVVANYVGGSALFFPIVDGKLSSTSESPLLKLPYVYSDTTAPNPARQEAAHAHHTIEGDDGVLYIADLGSDRVWVVKREGESGLKIVDGIVCPPGSGPRHLVISKDKKHLYVLCEMGHNVIAFPLPGATSSTKPLMDFDAPILPPSIPSSHSKFCDSAEIALNPSIPGVLYASNRLELHANELNKENGLDLPELTNQPGGDTVAIFLLSEAGDKIEKIEHVRTGCDSIRAMQISPDGQYAAIAGQRAGGVEIWKIGGERGDQWKLAAKDETVEQITDFVWL